MPTINTKSVRTYSKPPKRLSAEPTTLDIRTEIYKSSQWQNMRKGYLQEHPLCEVHLINGDYVPAQCVHHKKSFMLGKDDQEIMALAYSYGNLAALCHKCHNTIHGIMSNTIQGTTTGQSPLVIFNILKEYYRKNNMEDLQHDHHILNSSYVLF